MTFRKTLAMVAYLGAVAAFLVGSLGLIDDLKTGGGRVAEAALRLDQLSRRSPRMPPGMTGEMGQSLFLQRTHHDDRGSHFGAAHQGYGRKVRWRATSSQVEPDGPDAKDGFVRLTASIEVDQPGFKQFFMKSRPGRLTYSSTSFQFSLLRTSVRLKATISG